jgi:hypothetical protein
VKKGLVAFADNKFEVMHIQIPQINFDAVYALAVKNCPQKQQDP